MVEWHRPERTGREGGVARNEQRPVPGRDGPLLSLVTARDLERPRVVRPALLAGYSAFGQANWLQTACAFSGETVSNGSTSHSGGLTPSLSRLWAQSMACWPPVG